MSDDPVSLDPSDHPVERTGPTHRELTITMPIGLAHALDTTWASLNALHVELKRPDVAYGDFLLDVLRIGGASVDVGIDHAKRQMRLVKTPDELRREAQNGHGPA